MATIDRSDTGLALAAHATSGELYIVQSASVWADADHCTGTVIIASCGPINRRDLLGPDDTLEPSPELYDRIGRGDWELSDEDAGWLQDLEDQGLLTYPIGARV